MVAAAPPEGPAAGPPGRGGPTPVGPPAAAAAPRFPTDTPPPPRAAKLRSWLTPRLALPAGPLVRRGPACGVLMYHRFADPVPGLPAPTWNVPPDRLHAQLAGLIRRGFTPTRLEDLVENTAAGGAVDSRAFAVTIDDGYRNNLTRGLPVFEALGVPVTLFVATAYLDSPDPYPFDDWCGKGRSAAPADAWAAMTTAELRRFAASPVVSLGVHTHTHQDFRGRPDAFAADVTESCRVLREGFGVERPPLAFPYGTPERGFSRGELRRAAERTPVCCALTTADAGLRVGADRFDVGRFTATADDTAATLAAKLDGRFEAVKSWLHRVCGSACGGGA